MIKIPLKPKNYQNNPKTYKMTKYAQNPKNDQNIPREYFDHFLVSRLFWSIFRLQGYFGHF